MLSNAVRYTADGTEVTVRLRASPDQVRLSVVDLGRGLTAEQRERISVRFYRTDPSRSRALGGSGIGLAIAKPLVELMGGRTWAESAGPGTGATFTVALAHGGVRSGDGEHVAGIVRASRRRRCRRMRTGRNRRPGRRARRRRRIDRHCRTAA